MELAVFARELQAIPEAPGPALGQPAGLAVFSALAPRHKFPRKPRPSRESNATSVSLAFADLALRLHFQKVADHLVTAFGQYRFRVKLNALHRQGAVAQPHNDRRAPLAGTVGFRCAGRNF